MKPRLKISTSGKLTLLAQGVSGLTQQETKKLIRQRFGSLSHFASRFGLRYDALCYATSGNYAAKSAGYVAEVRCILGLPSQPTKAGLALAAAHAKRRLDSTLYAPALQPLSARAPVSQSRMTASAAERQSASGCSGVGTISEPLRA